MPVIRVDDPDDTRLDDYRHLRTGPRREQEESSRGIVIAEGELVIRQLLRSRFVVRSVLVTRPRLATLTVALDGLDAPVYVAEQDVLTTVAGFDVHRGALAAAERGSRPSLDEVVRPARRVVVLEGLTDHENVGSLFRNAAAFGVDGVLVDPRCCDPLYRRAVRVSMGHVLHVPFTVAEPWPDALDVVRDAGFVVVALTPRRDAEAIDHADLGAVERLALVVGTESSGITDAALARAHRRVRIPIAPGVDSLNVATAAAVALHRAQP